MAPPEKLVDEAEIREVFARGRFFQRFQDGEFDFEVNDVGPPLTRPGESFGQGIRERMVIYRHRQSRRMVAMVHHRAADEYGNPAAKTWADPKYVYHQGVRYKFSPNAELQTD